MIGGNYILSADGKPKLERDVIKWARWFEASGTSRIVKKTEVGKYRISTVFLATDYNFAGKGKPVLWETMVFQAMTKREADKENKAMADVFKSLKKRALPHDKKLISSLPKRKPMYYKGYQREADGFGMRRYTSREDAIKGHNSMVRLVKKEVK